MLVPVGTVCEFSLAIVTAVRTLARVNVHVVLVDLFLDEAFVANLADVRHLRVLKREKHAICCWGNLIGNAIYGG